MENPRNSLTREERRRLREIEATLTDDDPQLAESLASIDRQRLPHRRTMWSWSVATLLGFTTLTIGLVARAPWLGGAGFVLSVAAIDRLLGPRRVLPRLLALYESLDLGSTPDGSGHG